MTPNFFTDNSPFLNHPLLTPERTAAEIDFILQHTQATSFLDVGCGFGRHSLELANRGFETVGIDPAEAMIGAANERKAELSPDARGKVRFHIANGENFRTDQPFDAALCLMTTLGQVSANGENNELLPAIHANLKQNGRLFLEVPQKEAMIAGLKADDRFGSDTHYTAIQRKFDKQTEQIIEKFEIVTPDSTKEFLLSYQLYSRTEVETQLAQAGFTIVSATADFAGNPLLADSLNMVFVANAR